MSGMLKDDLTVALDDVDRAASRIVTIYEDLQAIRSATAGTDELARRLAEQAERRRGALAAFNRARRAAGQTPEVGDPERAHLESLWLTLQAAVSSEQSDERVQRSLADLDRHLADAIQAALALCPPPDIEAALRELASAQPGLP